MKRFIWILLLGIVLSLLSSCEQPTMLSINQTALTFDNGGGNQSVAITANKMWTTSSNQGWLRVSPPSGEGSASISVSCEANTTYDSRTGTITIKSEELTQTISVTQAEGQGLLVSQVEYNLSNEAQTISVEVKANVQYTVDIDAACRDWIKQNSTKALSSNTIKFDISMNEAYDGREGKITIKQSNGSLSATVVVKQSQTNGMFVDQTAYDVSNEAQQLNIKVKANVDYDVQIDDSFKDWISRVGTKGLTESTVTLAIAMNEDVEREGKVILKYGSIQEVVNIKQAGGFVEFEDAEFRTYCINNFDVNLDGKISYAEAKQVGKIKVRGNEISSLKGIEFMPNLDTLICYGYGSNVGQLTELDVTKNTTLLYLDCANNQLSTLDLTNCPLLTYLDCAKNYLKQLDLSNNTALTYIRCDKNELTEIDISNNIALQELECSHNQLSNIDISKNTVLTKLDCDHNKCTRLDFNGNTSLTYLRCSNNQLTSIDVRGCSALSTLACGSNPLYAIDVSDCSELTVLNCSGNQLSNLDVKNNTLLSSLWCGNNQLTSLDLENNNALQELVCQENQLKSLDVHNCTALKSIGCTGNQLTTLDVSGLTYLTSILCVNNQLESLTASGCTALKELRVEDNPLSNLDISGCTAFKNLFTYVFGESASSLESLNISGCSSLPERLSFFGFNKLITLNASGCTALKSLTFEDIGSNDPIESINVSGCTALENLWCGYNHHLRDINVDGCTALSELRCSYDEHLESLDVSSNTSMERLYLWGCKLTSLDLSKNKELIYLSCGSNALSSLDISNNAKLKELWCSSNSISVLDFSKNVALETIVCVNNKLRVLDVSNNMLLTTLRCYDNPNLLEIFLSKNQSISDFQYDTNVATIKYK